MPNTDSFQPVLQWRKLDGDSTAKKDAPWISSGNREKKQSPGERQTETKKVSRQDSINADAVCRRRQLEGAAKTNNKSSEHDRRTHIVESRKIQYSHCNMAKEEKSPLLYNQNSSTKHATKKVAALHLLQPLSMDHDVSSRTNESAKDKDENQTARKNESARDDEKHPAVCISSSREVTVQHLQFSVDSE